MLKVNSNYRSKRFPYWLRQSVRTDDAVRDTKELIRDLRLNTVCQSAQCPNIYDCFAKKRCTFLLLGNRCTRNCRFCAVEKRKTQTLQAPQKEELFNIKEAVRRLDLRKVVITSVTRDDLSDGGAGHFAECIEILKGLSAGLDIEVLVPDFLGKKESIEKVVSGGPRGFSHNVETVPRLFTRVRPEAEYQRSLDAIRYAKEIAPWLITKSGLMVGLGETRKEVYNVMKDLKESGCDIITIGQYLMPNPHCLEVEEFLHPDEFVQFSKWARELGFEKFSCSPFTRSSKEGIWQS